VAKSRDTAADWKVRFEGLNNDMLQAQAQLAGVRDVTVERNDLKHQLQLMQNEMLSMRREMAIAQQHEEQVKRQLLQVQTLATELEQQKCAAAFRAQEQETRADALHDNYTALQAYMGETGHSSREELEEAEHKLEALQTVKDALEGQTKLMREEAESMLTKLHVAERDASSSQADRNEMLQHLQVVEGVRLTLDGRLKCAQDDVEKMTSQLIEQRQLLAQEQQAHAQTSTLLCQEQAGISLSTHLIYSSHLLLLLACTSARHIAHIGPSEVGLRRAYPASKGDPASPI